MNIPRSKGKGEAHFHSFSSKSLRSLMWCILIGRCLSFMTIFTNPLRVKTLEIIPSFCNVSHFSRIFRFVSHKSSRKLKDQLVLRFFNFQRFFMQYSVTFLLMNRMMVGVVLSPSRFFSLWHPTTSYDPTGRKPILWMISKQIISSLSWGTLSGIPSIIKFCRRLYWLVVVTSFSTRMRSSPRIWMFSLLSLAIFWFSSLSSFTISSWIWFLQETCKHSNKEAERQ